jgi:hypothetical protein
VGCSVTIRFLLDENRSPLLADAIRRRDLSIGVLRVGDVGAPPLHTLDPEVLLYCEREQRLLVTNNRRSMAKYIADHLAAGHHHWGVFRLSRGMSLGQLSEHLHLLWAASEAEEWIDRFEWIPWKKRG